MAGPIERKLAAILSADVVGYSRLMAEDEASNCSRQSQRIEESASPVRHCECTRTSVGLPRLIRPLTSATCSRFIDGQS